MIRTNLKLALASVKNAKVRTALTMVAVIIGISSFTVVTSTIDGLKNAAAGEINEFGGNLVQIVPGNVIIENEDGSRELNFAASFGTSTITRDDLKDIEAIEGISSIAPVGLIGAQVSRNDQILETASVIATTPEFPETFSQSVEQGVFLSDQVTASRLAVVGEGVVEELFGGNLSLGARLTIRGEDFTVVGVMAEYESALSFAGGPDLNKAVFISLDDAAEISQGLLSIQEVDLQLNPDSDAQKVKEDITNVLIENHKGEKDFTVLTQEEIIELTDSLFGIIKQAGQFLSAVMLFVSSIVILLIMLITVRERTREIGIRKSIGATNSNILVQFLAEALTLSWLGSAIGVLLGFGAGLLVKNLTDITPAYSINTFVTLLGISTAVGVAAGVIPAWIAARKDPVDSLRHE